MEANVKKKVEGVENIVIVVGWPCQRGLSV